MSTDQDPGLCLPSGGYFKFLDPCGSEYYIEDIAHHLSHLNRYNGGTHYPYSVAQHSINASRIVAPEFAFEALMHDAAEFAFGDMTSPLKRLCGDYRGLLEAAEISIARKFGLPLTISPEVKLADMQMLKLEKEHLVPKPHTYERAAWPKWDEYHLDPSVAKMATLHQLPPSVVRKTFLKRYWELLP